MIWGERVVAASMKRALEREIPGANVQSWAWTDRPRLEQMSIDLLISAYTGPRPPWRWDDVAELVSGISMLMVYNHAYRLDEFSRLPFDGFITNSRRGVALLGRARPAAWVPLAADPELHRPVTPQPRYRASVVFLGSGGLGHRTAETFERYLRPALDAGVQIWGAYWSEAYWAPTFAERPELNTWHEHWRGPLPVGETAALYSSADVVLGFHETSQRDCGMWNNRVFEALACGATFVCDEAEGLAEEFGEAVVTTPGGDRLAETLRWLLADPAERARRGRIGRDLVLERFTYAHWARRVHRFALELSERKAAAGGRVATLSAAVPA